MRAPAYLLACASLLIAGPAWANAQGDALTRQGGLELRAAHVDPFNRLKHLKAAIDDLQAAIRVDPNNWIARHNLAEAAFQTGEYGFAVEEFTKAIALKPDSARSYLARGNAHLELGHEDAAQQDYARAEQLDQSLRPVIAQQEASVRAHVHQRQVAEAEAEYRKTHPAPPVSGPIFDSSARYFACIRNGGTVFYGTCTPR